MASARLAALPEPEYGVVPHPKESRIHLLHMQDDEPGTNPACFDHGMHGPFEGFYLRGFHLLTEGCCSCRWPPSRNVRCHVLVEFR